MKRTLVAATLTLLAAINAHAGVVLDQQHDFSSSIADSTSGNVLEVGQTFTVGVAGTLDHIDVMMHRLGDSFDPTGDPKLSLYSTSGGAPTGTPLATVIVPEATVPLGSVGFVTFDLSSEGILVDVGDVLAFGISTSSEAGPYFLRHDPDLGAVDDYTAGNGFWRELNPPNGPPDADWTLWESIRDYGFKTFVNEVPEPSTLALAAIGLFTTACLARRRK